VASPSPIDARILEKSTPNEAAHQTMQLMSQSTPTKGSGHPEEVLKALVFLAFDGMYAAIVQTGRRRESLRALSWRESRDERFLAVGTRTPKPRINERSPNFAR